MSSIGEKWKKESQLTKEPHTAGPTFDGVDDRHAKFPQVCLRFEFMDTEKRLIDGKGMLYGTLLGAPLYVPGKGVQFVMEAVHPEGWDNWVQGKWKVTLHPTEEAITALTAAKPGGENPDPLFRIWCMICQSLEVFVREGKDVERIEIDLASIAGSEPPVSKTPYHS